MSIAQVQPDAISYVEAHGSGTPLGDDIELEALSRAFAAARSNHFFVQLVQPKPISAMSRWLPGQPV
ncbi:hypothetical protein ACFSQ7_25245 [Paenibacillus rhizoplanae]